MDEDCDMVWHDGGVTLLLLLLLQDTPGYGDDTNISTSIQLIVDFILKKNEEYLKMEADAERKKSVGSQKDPRVRQIEKKLMGNG